MNYLSVENLGKRFGEKVLFEQLSFGVQKGEKVALVAKNGSGKSTLMRILMGQEIIDTGEYRFRKDMRVGFLPQEPDFGTLATVGQALLQSDNPLLNAVREYEEALENSEDSARLTQALARMDDLKAWDFETRIKQILTRFEVGRLQQSLDSLSGGQRKRVALARLLIDEPEFLLLDEPTNHLDLEMIEWLEEYLLTSNRTLLMVTHDRYFLERVCNRILELDGGQLYQYPGNYSYFLEQKELRQQQEGQTVSKARNLMRKELDWVRRQPKARGTKSKARLDAFEDLKKTAQKNIQKEELQLGLPMQRLGKKVLELENVSKSWGDLVVLQDFSYIFKRRERVGIVGKNGVGKSTFLHLLTGGLAPDAGTLSPGETISFGYYRQEGLPLAGDKRVIEIIQEIAEVAPSQSGQQLSAAQMLERFLFDRKAQYAYVSTLSGGERRRLYLLTILMQQPNFLILDEPTNDLDLLTLQVLEDFLHHYEGCLLVVTHDRFFLDKLVDHLLIFEGQGKIRDFNGRYDDYHALVALEEAEKKEKTRPSPPPPSAAPEKKPEKRKLSYREQQEYTQLGLEIEALEKEKEALAKILNEGTLDHVALQKTAEAITQIIQSLDQKTDRWLELSEFI
ncbi:MAG: ABC-F family ATP-binding cassette domain-containing protein [Microscillaceae bacterium]